MSKSDQYIELSDHDKRILGNIGRGAYGKELIDIIKKIRNKLSSLDGLEPGQDHNAEVEGRLLFKGLADELIERLTAERLNRPQIDPEEFE